MRNRTIKLSFAGVATIGVALSLVAIAVAQAGDGDSGDQSTETPGVAPTTSPLATPGTTDAPSPTLRANSATLTADGAAPDTGGPAPDKVGETGGSIEGTTPALNPGGHCVELPNDSDVIQTPDKHPNWVVGGCDPGDIGPPGGTEEPGESNGPPGGRTPSLNPQGVCVNLPNNSDIVQNPGKHPNWTVGVC